MVDRCPTCDGDSTVIDSRVRKRDFGQIRRRRECVRCRRRWSTIEIFADDQPLTTMQLGRIAMAAKTILGVLERKNEE